MSDLLTAVLANADWAKTMQGFLILVSIAALGYAAKLGIAHLIANVRDRRLENERRIREMESRLRQAMLDVQIALAECQADGVSDRGFISSWRALCAEYRTVLLQVTGGKRGMPPEVADMEEKYQQLRRALHEENNRRIARLKERVAQLERDSAAAEDDK